jgi:hypothetical protein
VRVPVGDASWGRGRRGYGERAQVEGDGRRAPASPAVGPRQRGNSSGPQQTNVSGALNITSMARDAVALGSQQVKTATAPPTAPRRSGMRPPQETGREWLPPARRREEPLVRQTNGGDASRLRPASLGRLVGATEGTGARDDNLISMGILQIGPRFQLKFIVSP